MTFQTGSKQLHANILRRKCSCRRFSSRSDGGRMSCPVAQPIGGQVVRSLGVSAVSFFKLIFTFQPVAGRFRDLNSSGFARCFQAAGKVDGFAPRSEEHTSEL